MSKEPKLCVLGVLGGKVNFEAIALKGMRRPRRGQVSFIEWLALLALGTLDMHQEFVARVLVAAEVAQHGAGRHIGVVFLHAANC